MSQYGPSCFGNSATIVAIRKITYPRVRQRKELHFICVSWCRSGGILSTWGWDRNNLGRGTEDTK
eukprot:1483682-Pyramimonas_sp.AAC.1